MIDVYSKIQSRYNVNFEKQFRDFEVSDEFHDPAKLEAAQSVYAEPTNTWGKIKRLPSVSWKGFLSATRRIEPTYATDMLFGATKGLGYIAKEWVWDPLKTAGMVGQDLYGGIWSDITGKDFTSTFDKKYQEAIAEGKGKEFKSETLWDLISLAPIGKLGKVVKGITKGTSKAVKGIGRAGVKGQFGPKFKDVPTVFSDVSKAFRVPENWFKSPFYRYPAKFLNATVVHPITGNAMKSGVRGRGAVGGSMFLAEKALGKIAGMPINKFVTNPIGKMALGTAMFAELGIRKGDILGMGRGGGEDQKYMAELTAMPVPPEEARLIQNPVVRLIADIGVGSAIGIPFLEKLGQGAQKLSKINEGVGVAMIDNVIDSGQYYNPKLLDKYQGRKILRGHIFNVLEETGRPVSPENVQDLMKAWAKEAKTLSVDDATGFKDSGVYRDAKTGTEFTADEKTKHWLNTVYDNVQGRGTAGATNETFETVSKRLLDRVEVEALPDEAFGYLNKHPQDYGFGRVREIPQAMKDPSGFEKKLASFREGGLGTYLTGNRADTELYRDTFDVFSRKLKDHDIFSKVSDDIFKQIDANFRGDAMIKVGNLKVAGKSTIQDLFIGDWKAILKEVGVKDADGKLAKELSKLARKSFAELSAKYVGLKPMVTNQLRANEYVTKSTVLGRIGRFGLRGMFHMQQLFEDLPYIAMDAKAIKAPKLKQAFTSVGFQSMDNLTREQAQSVSQLFHGKQGASIAGGFEAIGETTKSSSFLKYEEIKRAKDVSTRWVFEFADQMEKMPAIKKIMQSKGYTHVEEIPEVGKIFDEIATDPKAVYKYIQKFNLKDLPENSEFGFSAKEFKTPDVPGFTDRGIKWSGSDVTDALFEANRRAKRIAPDTARPYFLYYSRASGLERDLHSWLFPSRYVEKVLGKTGQFLTGGSIARPVTGKKIYEKHDEYLNWFQEEHPDEFNKIYKWDDVENIPDAVMKNAISMIYAAMPMDLRYGNISLGGPQPMLNALAQYAFDKVAESQGESFYRDYRVDTMVDLALKQIAKLTPLESGTPEYRLLQNWMRKYMVRWE